MSRYQRVYTYIWQDESFVALSPECQRLFIYLLSSPHSNIVGLYSLPVGYACGDLRCKDTEFLKWMNLIQMSGMARYDGEANVVLIPNYLTYNPMLSPNHVKAAHKIIKGLPKTKLIAEFVRACEAMPPEVTRSLHADIPAELTNWVPPHVANGNAKKPSANKSEVADDVWLSEAEAKRWTSEYGDETAAAMFQTLSEYKHSEKYLSRPESQKYTDDNRAIHSWVVGRFRERGMLKAKAKPVVAPVAAEDVY